MPPVRIGTADLASVLPPGGLTLVSSCSAESDLLANAVAQAGADLGAMTFCGVFVPGLNRQSWLAHDGARVLTFFQTPELRKAGSAVDFLPLCYTDILSLLRRRRPDALLTMVSPLGSDGRCSFGTTVDFIADLWREIPVRIAHINPAMPSTPGDKGIPFDELTAYIDGEQSLRSVADDPADPVAAAIASQIAAVVPDGATLQTGLGKIPGAALRALTGHRDLHFHTELIGDAVLDLANAGALAAGASVTAGVAIGSPTLYAALTDPLFDFRPVSVTHDLALIAAKGPFVAINSAIEVDLFGQVYSELTPRGFGHLDADGYLADRRSDLIISGGMNIWPAEIESAILEHSSVRSCAVFGLPDADLGHRVHAVIETDDKALDVAALRGFLRSRLAAQKLPKSMTSTEEAVRDDAGEVRKSAWQAQLKEDEHAR